MYEKGNDKEEYMTTAARESSHKLKGSFGRGIMEGSFGTGMPNKSGIFRRDGKDAAEAQ
ncbi:MAG: hypothetical protein K2J99_03705 [Lachnospiraceae bacterium]|nr:hypothetical protein [Lachnospiraceae bacterium]